MRRETDRRKIRLGNALRAIGHRDADMDTPIKLHHPYTFCQCTLICRVCSSLFGKANQRHTARP